ncbi:hypothetical protein CRYUN_Cryun20dG0027900 [Craigia yunnanensis]
MVQITARILCFGLFNGVGPTRTQSKMIVRGLSYSFATKIAWKDVQPQQCRDSTAIKLLNCFHVVDLAVIIVLEMVQYLGSAIKAWLLAGTVLRPLAMEMEK